MMAPESQEELKLSETHQLLLYADDVYLMEETIYATRKSTQAVSDTVWETGREVY
jgi:hypothetical protein